MAHEGNFCGGSLRSSVFSQIVQNLPQRPSRFRRRAPSPIAADSHAESQTSAIDAPLNSSAEGVLAAQKKRSQEDQQCLQEIHISAPEQGSHKNGVAVYASKATKTDPRRLSASNTSEECLPVSGLAFVRTTTTDGLSIRSVGSLLT